MSNKSDIKKKKIIIIVACIISLVLIFAILIGTFFHFQKQKDELNQNIMNTLDSGEILNETFENEEEGDNNILIVGIDDENKINENETNENSTAGNETNTNQNTTNNNNTVKKVEAPYYIKINNQANVVTVYKKNSNGEYKTPVKAMICSIGTATPKSGVYSISDKYTWRLLQGNVYGQYACRITGHILFHSVPYVKKDKSTLEWWEYDKLGTNASLGCIRLKVEDAKWIYDNCIPGTKVEFYYSSDPGPLGKPTSMKISDDEEVRNWDPTDPDKNNPWKEYLKKQESNKTQETTTKPVTDNTVTNNNIVNNTVTNNTTANNVITNNTVTKNNTTTSNNVNTNNTTSENKAQNKTNQVTTNSKQEVKDTTNPVNNINIVIE